MNGHDENPFCAVFPGPREMLGALSTMMPQTWGYPKVLVVEMNGTAGSPPVTRLALRLSPEAVEQFRRLSRQLEWAAEILPWADLARRAPRRRVMDPVELLGVEFRDLDPSDPGPHDWDRMEFHIGVGAEHAATVLDLLAVNRMHGLRAWPHLRPLRRPAGAALPDLLWSVRGAVPPRAVLHLARRVWYGPVATTLTDNRVYVEWPLHATITPECLERLTFLPVGEANPAEAMRGGLVLLSRDDPQVLLVTVPEGARQPQYVEVGGVRLRDAAWRAPAAEAVSRSNVAVAEASPAVPAGLHFDLELRLVPFAAAVDPQRECDRLDAEAARLRNQLAVLEERRRDVGEWVAARRAELPQPPAVLYLYRAPPGQVPPTLRRLLVERDDREELRGVLHHQFPADGLPGDLARPGTVVHAVTGPGATTDRSGTPAWFEDYPPGVGEGVVFRLLPEWVDFGLRLFVRDTRDREVLDFYPPLPPGAVAADRLRAALLPRGCPPTTAALLVHDPAGGLAAVTLDFARFRPLVEAIPWGSSVRIVPAGDAGLGSLAGRAADDVARQFREGAQAAVATLLAEQEREAAGRFERLERNRTELEARDSQIRDLERSLGELEARVRALWDEVTSGRGDAIRARQLLAEIVRVLDELEDRAT